MIKFTDMHAERYRIGSPLKILVLNITSIIRFSLGCQIIFQKLYKHTYVGADDQARANYTEQSMVDSSYRVVRVPI
jgi:hypothetical protein